MLRRRGRGGPSWRCANTGVAMTSFGQEASTTTRRDMYVTLVTGTSLHLPRQLTSTSSPPRGRTSSASSTRSAAAAASRPAGGRGHAGRPVAVTICYGAGVPRDAVSLSYDEAMAVCLLLAEAADASVDEEPVRDTWAEEARLMIELILGRTDER